MDAIKLLISLGATIDTQGSRALITAIGSGHLHIVKYLLNKGVDPNVISPDHIHPLALATECGTFDIAKELIYHGAQVCLNRIQHKTHTNTRNQTIT